MDSNLFGYLLAHPEVREYFALYQGGEWAQVLLNTLLMGIYALRSTHPRPLSVREMQEKIKRGGYIINAEQKIPNINQQICEMKTELTQIELALNSFPDSQSELKIIKEDKKLFENERLSSNIRQPMSTQTNYPDW